MSSTSFLKWKEATAHLLSKHIINVPDKVVGNWYLTTTSLELRHYKWINWRDYQRNELQTLEKGENLGHHDETTHTKQSTQEQTNKTRHNLPTSYMYPDLFLLFTNY